MGSTVLRCAAAHLSCVAAILAASAAQATIVKTTNQSQVNNFSQGMNVEAFDTGVTGTALSSYADGQLILEASRFSSRGSATNPTFHSGGASPNDPIGNPGSPIGIITPTGAISGDVESGENVAAPLVIATDEPWNGAFMEVIFFPGNVERVGFWVTHGPVRLDLRDRFGSNLTTGDVTVTGETGEFIGISRGGTSDISVVALTAQGKDGAFTIDDFTYPDTVPEPAAALLLGIGAGILGARRVRRPA
jgi:hypothetical protein